VHHRELLIEVVSSMTPGILKWWKSAAGFLSEGENTMPRSNDIRSYEVKSIVVTVGW